MASAGVKLGRTRRLLVDGIADINDDKPSIFPLYNCTNPTPAVTAVIPVLIAVRPNSTSSTLSLTQVQYSTNFSWITATVFAALVFAIFFATPIKPLVSAFLLGIGAAAAAFAAITAAAVVSFE